MNTAAASKSPAYIPQPQDEYKFQDLCQHVFAVVYNSPGAGQFGRRGQDQHGFDILVHDFRGQPMFSRSKMVGVQCKFTAEMKLSSTVMAKVKRNMQQVVDLIARGAGFQQLVLFVLATNVRNDSGLQANLEELKDDMKADFSVEVWDWDKLCSVIVGNPRLWDLYNNHPDLRLPIKHKEAVNSLEKTIRGAVIQHTLADAIDTENRWQQGRAPAYGHLGINAPAEIWERSAQLRATMLELYRAGADSYRAVPILQYELGLNKASASNLLALMTAQRIVGNLRNSAARLIYVRESPQFKLLLASYVDEILAAEGSPDDLACLALMLVMELDDIEAHDAALSMMARMVERTTDTQWQTVARIAHATVRYYYVLRNGWLEPARRYALGDTINRRGCVDLSSEMFDQPFDDPGPDMITVVGLNPLARLAVAGSSHTVLMRLGRRFGAGITEFLAGLLHHCQVYSADNFGFASAHWKGDAYTLLQRRVVVFGTLAWLATHSGHLAILNRFALWATEKTFERLLGYHRMLHAYTSRVPEDRSLTGVLERVEYLVKVCVYGRAAYDSEKGRILIAPVYDNPPPRPPVALGRYERPASCFTLAKDRLLHLSQWIANHSPDQPLRLELEERYCNRNDEFSLACMLALHGSTPMLHHDMSRCMKANSMGIGVEHPNMLSDEYGP